MSVFTIQLESQRKARPRVCTDVPPGSTGLPLCLSCLGGSSLSGWITALLHLWCWVLMWSSCSTAGPHLPQVVVSEESVEQRLHYVLFVFCKIPLCSWKTRVISQDSPKLAGRNKHCVLEKSVLGMKGEGERSPGKEEALCICREGILLSWGFAIALSLTLLILGGTDHTPLYPFLI